MYILPLLNPFLPNAIAIIEPNLSCIGLEEEVFPFKPNPVDATDTLIQPNIPRIHNCNNDKEVIDRVV